MAVPRPLRHLNQESRLTSGASPQFNVANTGVGTWRLTIPGQSPSTGVLIISAEGGLSQNQDNIVSYEPDADGWRTGTCENKKLWLVLNELGGLTLMVPDDY